MEKWFELFYAGTVRNGGWYLWMMRAGRIPEGQPMGPFPTQAEASILSTAWGYPVVVSDGK